MDQFDRQARRLDEAYENGQLSREEYDWEMRELILDQRAYAQDRAQEAYNDAMGGIY